MKDDLFSFQDDLLKHMCDILLDHWGFKHVMVLVSIRTKRNITMCSVHRDCAMRLRALTTHSKYALCLCTGLGIHHFSLT